MKFSDASSQGSITGTVCLVTGASRGIGRALAAALAEAGALVALASRTGEALDELVEEIARSGGRALGCVADVSKWEQVDSLYAIVRREMGPVELLVNNAAVITPVGAVEEIDPHEWKEALEINVTGAFYCSKRALETMVPRRKGTIINLVSGMGERVFARFSAYSVSKAALIHLTRILAAEVREHGVCVCAVDPGIVDTGMQEQLRAMPAERVGIEMHSRLIQYKREGMLRPAAEIARQLVGVIRSGALSLERSGELVSLGRLYAQGSLRVQGRPDPTRRH